MSHKNSTCQYGRASRATLASSVKARIALDESELAARWGLSVKTLRRWRQEQLGPVFCKLGSRVTYLISEIEAFERRVSRYSTSARAYQ
jgi:hypothetical protein